MGACRHDPVVMPPPELSALSIPLARLSDLLSDPLKWPDVPAMRADKRVFLGASLSFGKGVTSSVDVLAARQCLALSHVTSDQSTSSSLEVTRSRVASEQMQHHRWCTLRSQCSSRMSKKRCSRQPRWQGGWVSAITQSCTEDSRATGRRGEPPSAQRTPVAQLQELVSQGLGSEMSGQWLLVRPVGEHASSQPVSLLLRL